MWVMLYLTVLYIEFMPIVTERFLGKAPKRIDYLLLFLDKMLKKMMWFFYHFRNCALLSPPIIIGKHDGHRPLQDASLVVYTRLTLAFFEFRRCSGISLGHF